MFDKGLYKKYLIRASIGLLILNLVITGLLYFFLIEKGENEIYKNYMNSAKVSFSDTKDYLESKVIYFENILYAVEDSASFEEYLKFNKKDELSNIFQVLLKSNKFLFQIRYIDKNGMEKIRVDKDNNDQIFEAKRLQDKSSRYYFVKTISLKEDQFYISDLDLNIEYKKIEIPYKPTIRISKPVYIDNVLQGMLIINYNATEIIKNIQAKEFFDVYYMDKEGNFFLHSDSKKNYSTQLKTNFKVKDEIPNIDELVNNNKLLDKKQKYYISKISLTDNDFYIIYSLKDELYNRMYEDVQNDILPLFLLIFLITLPLVMYTLNKQATQSAILESIIDNTPFPIFLKDVKGKIIIANTQLVELCGYNSKDDLIGKQLSEVMDKDAAQKFEYTVHKVQELKNKDSVSDEIVIHSKNGKNYYYDMKVIKLSYLGLLQKSYILGIAVDITELKSINIQLQALVEEEVGKRMKLETSLVQQSKMAEMGNMLDNIIHQWKQPLSAISVIATTLSLKIEHGIGSLDEARLKLDEINDQVQFMHTTSNDFRAFFSSKKEKGKFLIENTINQIERILSHRVKDTSSSVEKRFENGISLIGYENELGQVILSIMNNALDKFNCANNNTLYIATFSKDKSFIIKISDNGGKIPDELLPSKLFEREFTTKDSGTGLGLAIGLKIIQDSFQGTIKAYNENNKATFEIELPNFYSIK